MKAVILLGAALVASSRWRWPASRTANPQYEPSQHIVHVVKVVENAPGDVSGVIDVCGHTVNWDADGADESVTIGDYFDGDQSCVVTEPDDGGANDVEGVPFTCEFTGKDAEHLTEGTDEKKYPDQVCEVRVENSYDEVTTTTVAPPLVIQAPPEIVTVPVPVIASPRFTG